MQHALHRDCTSTDSIESKALFVNLKQRLVQVRKKRRTRPLLSILCRVSTLFHHPIFYPTVRWTPLLLSSFSHQSVKYDVHTRMDHATIAHLKYYQAKLADLLSPECSYSESFVSSPLCLTFILLREIQKAPKQSRSIISPQAESSAVNTPQNLAFTNNMTPIVR